MALPKSQLEKRVDALEAKETGGGGGVGLAVGAHSEVFNGYPGDSAANVIEDGQWGYNRVAGAYNSLTGESQCTELGGYNNSAVHAYCSIIHGNDVKLKRYGGYSPYKSIVVGSDIRNYYNESQQGGGEIRESAVFGNNHFVANRADACIIGGRDMSVGNASQSLIVGQGHQIINANWCIVGGHAATVDGTTYRLVLGGSYDNCFTVDDLGYVKAKGTYSTMGADYAEFFEWADGNPDGEDRRGMLVALDGDKLIPAHGDDIIGIVSAAPSVVGNAYELHWRGKYATDVYGNIITTPGGEPLISPEFDPAREYIPRSQRPEWAAVGLVGQLVVRDDGSCKVGSYISARQGIATKCYALTPGRVIQRIDKTHVKVLLK